jgi:hypothetical protein
MPEMSGLVLNLKNAFRIWIESAQGIPDVAGSGFKTLVLCRIALFSYCYPSGPGLIFQTYLRAPGDRHDNEKYLNQMFSETEWNIFYIQD